MREPKLPRVSRRPRALFVALAFSWLALLAPDLMLAPIQAGEPHTGPQQLDMAAAGHRRSLPRPIDQDRRTAGTVIPPVAPAVSIDATAFQRALDAARAEAKAHGVAFAVVHDGSVEWFGASGRQRDGRTALTADAPFVIGSVTKTYVAATILQLVEEGRLELDASVRQVLPNVKSIDREVTVRQLLDHTSGLADLFNDSTRRGIEEHPEHAWTPSEVLATLHAPWYEPGEGWAYANTNYLVLGLIVERLTGRDLDDELSDRFLEPLGLDATRMLPPGVDDGGPLEPAWTSIFWASGAMTASAADLARWGNALYAGSVLEDESVAAMIRLNADDYGLGTQRIELKGTIGYGHTGLLNTYTTLLVHLPEEDRTLALLVNRSHVDLAAMLAATPGDDEPSLLELAGVKVELIEKVAPAD